MFSFSAIDAQTSPLLISIWEEKNYKPEKRHKLKSERQQKRLAYLVFSVALLYELCVYYFGLSTDLHNPFAIALLLAILCQGCILFGSTLLLLFGPTAFFKDHCRKLNYAIPAASFMSKERIIEKANAILIDRAICLIQTNESDDLARLYPEFAKKADEDLKSLHSLFYHNWGLVSENRGFYLGEARKRIEHKSDMCIRPKTA